jgi:hypothetical protein
LANKGLGIAFVRALSFLASPHSLRVQLHIKDPDYHRTIGLISFKRKYASITVEQFRQYKINYFHELSIKLKAINNYHYSKFW